MSGVLEIGRMTYHVPLQPSIEARVVRAGVPGSSDAKSVTKTRRNIGLAVLSCTSPYE